MTRSFQDIFVGSEHAHGEWHPEVGEKGEGRTKREPASATDYVDHLTGKQGLGLVPVRGDSTCRFAAIDIDVDTIDHAKLYRAVATRRFPLTVCRSKSGGAHLYLFAAEPGLKTSLVIPTLRRWAGLLGYPHAEIFPKQLATSKKDFGNWINLPYFGGDNTTRYAFGSDGALSLQEFLDSVVLFDGKADVDEVATKELVQISTMPPCLAKLTEEGLPEGTRNDGLLNFAVYYRKSHPNGWEDLLAVHNQNNVKPPLSQRELQNIIKSVGKTKYQYTCSREPICSRCDRDACLSTPFGVGHMPWKERGSYDDVLVSHLRKITSDPPRYIVEVNGHDLECEYEQLFMRSEFRKLVGKYMDMIIEPMKQDQWDQVIKELLANKEDIEAPKDASPKGMLIDKIHDFLGLFERARSRDDLLKGVPAEEDGMILFRVGDLQKYLTGHRVDRVSNDQLYQVLYSHGGSYKTMRLLGRPTTVWMLPKTHLSRQTKDFKPQEFDESLQGEL